jgi:hypothetical protein
MRIIALAFKNAAEQNLLKVPVNDIVLSVSTIHRKRTESRQNVVADLIENLGRTLPVTLHWDDITVPDVRGTNKVHRLATWRALSIIKALSCDTPNVNLGSHAGICVLLSKTFDRHEKIAWRRSFQRLPTNVAANPKPEVRVLRR